MMAQSRHTLQKTPRTAKRRSQLREMVVIPSEVEESRGMSLRITRLDPSTPLRFVRMTAALGAVVEFHRSKDDGRRASQTQRFPVNERTRAAHRHARAHGGQRRGRLRWLVAVERLAPLAGRF